MRCCQPLPAWHRVDMVQQDGQTKIMQYLWSACGSISISHRLPSPTMRVSRILPENRGTDRGYYCITVKQVFIPVQLRPILDECNDSYCHPPPWFLSSYYVYTRSTESRQARYTHIDDSLVFTLAATGELFRVYIT